MQGPEPGRYKATRHLTCVGRSVPVEEPLPKEASAGDNQFPLLVEFRMDTVNKKKRGETKKKRGGAGTNHAEPFLLAICGLHLHCLGVVVAHKAPICTGTAGSTNVSIHGFLGAPLTERLEREGGRGRQGSKRREE